jgi:hypothetical protein
MTVAAKTRFGQQDCECQRSIQLAGVLDSYTRCHGLMPQTA